MSSRSASSSSHMATAPSPTASGGCRPPRRGPDHSPRSSRPPSRWLISSPRPPAPHSTSRKESSSVWEPTPKPRPGWPPRCSGWRWPGGPATSAPRRHQSTRMEKLVEKLPGDILTRHAEIDATVLSARGVVQFWSGHFDEAAVEPRRGGSRGRPLREHVRARRLLRISGPPGGPARTAEPRRRASGRGNRPSGRERHRARRACLRSSRGGTRVGSSGAQRAARRARSAEASRRRPASPAGKAGRRRGLPRGGALPPGRRPRQGGVGDDRPRTARLVASQLARAHG